MTPRSLRLRLLIAGGLAIVAALIVAGGALIAMFEHHVERTLDDDLDAYVRQIAGRLETEPGTGRLRLSQFTSDPRFETPLSGFYWQVSDSGSSDIIRSRSLWDSILLTPGECITDGQTRYYYPLGPARQELLAGEICIKWSGSNGQTTVRILAGIDRASLRPARDAFAMELNASLIILALALMTAMWLQVSLGLAPLSRLGADVAEIARGARGRLDAGGPAEVQPLVDEINGLLDEREKEIERARNRAADLAHGLRTPLTALGADARLLREKGESDVAQSLERIGDVMQRHVARELARARVKRVHRDGTLAETPVREVVDALVRTLERTGVEVRFEVSIDSKLMVALDRIDLMEVIGNLLENASRYALSLVRVSAIEDQGLFRLVIEDDGPGLQEDDARVARQRGGRLDETGGAGLGLAIVQDVLDAYGTTMKFSRSDLGGLRVSINLSSGLLEQNH